jgi:hypothetical protein
VPIDDEHAETMAAIARLGMAYPHSCEGPPQSEEFRHELWQRPSKAHRLLRHCALVEHVLWFAPEPLPGAQKATK